MHPQDEADIAQKELAYGGHKLPLWRWLKAKAALLDAEYRRIGHDSRYSSWYANLLEREIASGRSWVKEKE